MKTTIALALAGLLLAVAPTARAADASFDLKLPCKVLSYDAADSGAWHGQLIGADGALLDFSWAGEAAAQSVVLDTKDGAESLATGSKAETRFVEALQGWVDTILPVDDQATVYAAVLGPNGLDQAAWDEVTKGRSVEEIRALHVERLVRFLERRREQAAGKL